MTQKPRFIESDDHLLMLAMYGVIVKANRNVSMVFFSSYKKKVLIAV